MAEDNYNRKNPAVKRILQEVKEMQFNPSDDFMSLPLEENIFEWQFAFRGPRDSEFEGGIYHGRIQLPADYPLKPPSFMLLTPNGRFATQTKICLSISNHHPEHWQPSWSVRTALLALVAFMPTSPNGALGSLDYPKEERRALAVKSCKAAPKIHEYMLSKSVPAPQCKEEPEVRTNNEEIEGPHSPENDVVEDTTENDEIAEERNTSPSNAAQTLMPVPVEPTSEVCKQADDRLFTWAAFGLTVAIIVLLLKKFLKANGHGAVFMNES